MILLVLAAAGATTLEDRAVDAYRRAADFVVAAQNADGSWSRQGYPTLAYTGLHAAALLRAPDEIRDRFAEPARRALAWLTAQQNEDGSFSEMMTTHKTYTTGIALMAMSATDESRQEHADAIRRAQEWMRSSQMDDGLYEGGMGYGDRQVRQTDQGVTIEESQVPNLSTTGLAADGLHASGLPADDPLYQLMTRFAQSCQNDSESNTNEVLLQRLNEAGYLLGDDGGFVYAPFPPDRNKPSDVVHEDGTRSMRSYGSMTYAGLKTYLYAGLSREDPRVEAAMQWIRSHYRVDGHPGFEYEETERAEDTGLFYYYMTMTRALDAWGERPLALADGTSVDWAEDLAREILARQRNDGSWVNENPRWWEDDPMLVTGYMLQTLDILIRRLGE